MTLRGQSRVIRVSDFEILATIREDASFDEKIDLGWRCRRGAHTRTGCSAAADKPNTLMTHQAQRTRTNSQQAQINAASRNPIRRAIALRF